MAFDYDFLVGHAGRSVALDVLRRTKLLGTLPGKHYFYLTIDLTVPGVEIPAHLRAKYAPQLTFVLQNLFRELVVETDRFAVTLTFSGEPARLEVPINALMGLVDPSEDFGVEFPEMTPSSLREAHGLVAYVGDALAVLEPLNRVDYGASLDKVRRAVLAWTMRNVVQETGLAGPSFLELMIDNYSPGAQQNILGAVHAPEVIQKIDRTCSSFELLPNMFSYDNQHGRISLPLAAIRMARWGGDGFVMLEEAPPDVIEVDSTSAAARLQIDAQRASRAIAVFTLRQAALLGRLPFGHHFYIKFLTHFPGVVISDDLAVRHPHDMTVVIQNSYDEPACDNDAFLVTLSFGGVEQRLRIPFLSILSFRDPDAGFDSAFLEVDPSNAGRDQKFLDAALARIGQPSAIDALDYMKLEQRATRAAVVETVEYLRNEQQQLLSSERYEVTHHSGMIFAIDSRVHETLSVTTAGMSWQDGSDHREVQFSDRKACTSHSSVGSCTLEFDKSSDLDGSPLHAIEPFHLYLVKRDIANNAGSVHEISGKDTTGKKAYYYIFVPPGREREFLSAFEDDDEVVDLDEYGIVLGSYYAEDVDERKKRQFLALYDFNK